MAQVLASTTLQSKVWLQNGWVHKKQPKFLTDNEFHALVQMEPSGYVPAVEKVGTEEVRMEFLGLNRLVTNISEFISHYPKVLEALQAAGVRHGDLTKYSIIVRGNKPYLVDFGESRHILDPRPDKRAGGDAYWLAKTMANMCPWGWHNGRSGEMWNIIDEWVDFKNATVLDAGCGYGDFLIRSLMAGAGVVWGVDNDQGIVNYVRDKVGPLPIELYCGDMEIMLTNPIRFDIILCLSVLPYVDTEMMLGLIAERSKTAVIECQYEGDGPGDIKNDAEMRHMLQKFWKKPIKIGQTVVKEGRFTRSIWMLRT